MIGLEGDFHNDFRFDEFLMLGEAETEAVAEELAPIIDAKRQRARKAKEAEAFNRTVGLVVANALIGGERRVHYSRHLEAYSGASPYRPAWLGSRRLLGVIDGLANGGLVTAFDGRWAGVFSKGLRSSFAAAPPLIEILEDFGIGPHCVKRDWKTAPALVLKGKDDCLIRYDPTAGQVAQQTEELRAYNAFIAAQDITLSGKDAPRFGGLTRIYNDGDWGSGGRHFGGWWQPLSEEVRSTILINGQETVELDYGGFFPRALYHQTGQEFAGEDPYDIPEIRRLMEANGIDWKPKGRKAAKTMVNIAISAKRKTAFLSEKSQKKISLPENIIVSCIPLLIDYHEPIKGHLFKGLSLGLMNIESDICHRILCNGMNDGAIILPVFDSFITTKDREDYLHHQMMVGYMERLMKKPTIH